MSDEYVSELSAIATVTVLRREIAEKDKRIAELSKECQSRGEEILALRELIEDSFAENKELKTELDEKMAWARACKNEHEKGQPCDYEELTASELVKIIEELEAENDRLKYNERLLLAAVQVVGTNQKLSDALAAKQEKDND